MACAKSVLLSLNIFVMVIGGAILVLGILALHKPDVIFSIFQYMSVKESYMDPVVQAMNRGAWVLVILGSFICVLTFLGFCGTCINNRIPLIIYNAALTILIIAEIAFLLFAVLFPKTVIIVIVIVVVL
ncbi:hypothetical protein HELRODRAFT_181357 [Helobdella robusta]|uniref:Tetraspanin n=1 Tax=Helobdella robusta TaxID=6412 RepID=T1FGX3_HELRO|nr:hypothetical protein HELRODRAFT_181357 [Helobdella robusta]ESN92485.1 hypothetical protein HELRODRAFT_181357 [Helobdella robusta]